MWQRKSQDEIDLLISQKQADLSNPFKALLFAGLFTVAAILFYALGIRSLRTAVIVVDNGLGFVQNLLRLGPMAAVLFVFSFLFIFWTRRQKVTNPFASEQILFCQNCQENMHRNSTRICHCGCAQEPLDFYRWVDSPQEFLNENLSKIRQD